jgi:hypothetical protein
MSKKNLTLAPVDAAEVTIVMDTFVDVLMAGRRSPIPSGL